MFTDVTCFYCQKLHKEVPELNKRGVEVRYLAYPRAGCGFSEVIKQLASAWCADNPQETLTKLKNKKSVQQKNVCPDNPVAEPVSAWARNWVCAAHPPLSPRMADDSRLPVSG